MACSGKRVKLGEEAHARVINRMGNIRKRRLITYLPVLYFTLSFVQIQAESTVNGPTTNPAVDNKYSASIYSGPGSPSPFADIARIRGIELTTDFIVTGALSRQIWTDENNVTIEGELQVIKHLERLSLFSLNAAIVLRWLKTPWHRVVPGSFAFGNGLSYATGIPNLEVSRLPVNSRLLYHLLIEMAFPLSIWTGFETFFRVHHRSGGFGLFGGVVGGSDFLCLGLRYRF